MAFKSVKKGMAELKCAIHVEIPRAARFEADATTNVGEVLINRDDIERPKASPQSEGERGRQAH